MGYLLLAGIVWAIVVPLFFCREFVSDTFKYYFGRRPREYCFHFWLRQGGHFILGGHATTDADEAAAWLIQQFPDSKIVRLSCGVCLDEVTDPDLVMLTAKISPYWAKAARQSRVA